MFCVSESESASIRTAFEQGGELSAAVELRRLFPGIDNMAKARKCALMIVGWAPTLPPPPATVTRLKPKRRTPA